LGLAAGAMQLIGYAAVLLASTVFTFVWLLRGPPIPAQSTDAYWSGVWAWVFLVLATASCVGAAFTLRAWHKQGYRWNLGVNELRTIQVDRSRRFSEFESSSRAGRRARLELETPFGKLDVDASDDRDESASARETESEQFGMENEWAHAAVDIPRRNTDSAEFSDRGNTYDVATIQFSHLPIALWLFVLLCIGSFNESLARRNMATLALHEAANE
jgi:hypothetical protein